MEKQERFSSLHDDIQIPWITHQAGIGEYKEFPITRFDPKDKSILFRMSQFGVDFKTLAAQGFDPNQMTADKYRNLIREALVQRYDIIFGSVIDKYVMGGFGDPKSQTERLKQVMRQADEYQNWGINIVKNGKDLKPDQANLVIALEGADFVASMADIEKLLESGVRVFGLQYNKDNEVAKNIDGLTPFGAKVVKRLLLENKGIDLAHSSLKTRTGIMDIAQDLDKGHLVSYTHGSTTSDVSPDWKTKLAKSERLLKPEELQRIISMGGVVGLGVTKPFFGSIQAMAERIDQTCQLDNGVSQIAIGSDFGGVWNEMGFGIESIDDLRKLADQLSGQFGMNDNDINKILRTNAKDWVTKALQ